MPLQQLKIKILIQLNSQSPLFYPKQINVGQKISIFKTKFQKRFIQNINPIKYFCFWIEKESKRWCIINICEPGLAINWDDGPFKAKIHLRRVEKDRIE